MTLHRVLDPLATRLADALTGVRVDDVAPVVIGDLPCAVLSLDAVTQSLAGIGRVPRGTRIGALRLSATIDLANPVLDLGDGETLNLLSIDRLTLTLPHGPVVRADGTPDPPFAPGDVSADDGAPFTVVSGAPTGRQVQADPREGTLLFGVPLGTTGDLEVTYHLGQWDVVTTRVQGTLGIEVLADSPNQAADTSRAVATALAGTDAATRATPLSWGAVRHTLLPGEVAIRSQTTTYHLDAELEEPVLTSGGGVISQVAVTGAFADPPGIPLPIEPFTVTRGATT
jgi:hypothetical protein